MMVWASRGAGLGLSDIQRGIFSTYHTVDIPNGNRANSHVHIAFLICLCQPVLAPGPAVLLGIPRLETKRVALVGGVPRISATRQTPQSTCPRCPTSNPLPQRSYCANRGRAPAFYPIASYRRRVARYRPHPRRRPFRENRWLARHQQCSAEATDIRRRAGSESAAEMIREPSLLRCRGATAGTTPSRSSGQQRNPAFRFRN